VDQAARVAEWHASADRLLALAEALEAMETERGGFRPVDEGAALVLDDVVLRHPDGTPLAGPLRATLPAGSRVAVSAEGRAVPALFLAIAGLWPWGEGRLVRPAGHRLAVLPRRPWLPEGRLAALLAPPEGAPRETLAAALEVVGLAALVPRLEEVADWGAELPEGEGLRLGLARLLLGRPDLVLIDALAGPLGPAEAARLIGLVAHALPGAILLAAGHAAPDWPLRLDMAAPEGLVPGRAARVAARRRASRLIAWLRRGFGHRKD
jgi:putative ATP-binding cassette transporter